MKEAIYDLEERLLNHAVRIIRLTEAMPHNRSARYVADQLLRSGCSPYGNHGEAEGAESRHDFVHKLRICYKELRETHRWLRLVAKVPLVAQPEALTSLLQESDELVRIFAASVRTAQRNQPREPRERPPA
jgi:four helix bundle protein